MLGLRRLNSMFKPLPMVVKMRPMTQALMVLQGSVSSSVFGTAEATSG